VLFTATIGFLFGFIGSIPVAGPVAALIFARSIDGRFRSGVYIGIGCASAEMVYACLAYWGFSAFLAEVPWIVPVSRAGAAILLVALGILFLTKKGGPPAPEDARKDHGLGSFLVGFSLTALNPTLIATWTAAATTLFSSGLVRFEPALAVPFGLGAGVGIVSWFALLVGVIRRYKDRFRYSVLLGVLRVMGVFLLALAAGFGYAFVDYLVS
jgi:threonine/homoserine/homoserine lactone efflux protein